MMNGHIDNLENEKEDTFGGENRLNEYNNLSKEVILICKI